jgi:hypothetical protein
MPRIILAFLTLSITPAVMAQDVAKNQSSEITDLKSQLQTEHERVQQLLDAVQQLQQQVTQLQSEKSRETSGQPGEASTNLQLAAAPPPAAKNTKSGENSDQVPAIHFKGITLTPGVFFDGTGIYRTHNENADAISTFGAIPFSGTANSHLSEFRGTGRDTRLSLLAEGKLDGWKVSGYAEYDFEGAAPTANEVEANSFQPRARQLWAQAEASDGITVSAGQTWSLITTNRKGIALRQEWIPNTIDLQYVVGYNWARQWSVRATEKLSDYLWAAFSVENPETVLSVTNPPANVFGFANSPNAQTPSSAFTTSITPGATGISTDLAPDLIAKVAFEPGFGHYEIKALGRFFRNRFSGSNNYKVGGGIGVAAILPLEAREKKFDFIVEGLIGTGIGRYASGAGADVTLRPNATLVPLRSLQTMGGIEAHPGQFDVYVYGGVEYYPRANYVNATGLGVGYGSPLANNSGCSIEVTTAATPCEAQNRSLWQLQPGYWYNFYKGPAGRLAVGMSYSYTQRATWVGLNGLQPRAIENMVMSTFRYYLP